MKFPVERVHSIGPALFGPQICYSLCWALKCLDEFYQNEAPVGAVFYCLGPIFQFVSEFRAPIGVALTNT